MASKILFLLCDSYPFSVGEFFIDDEMQIISKYFEKIFVITSSKKSSKELNRFIPKNMKIILFSRKEMERKKYLSCYRLFFPMVLRELLFIVRLLPYNQWLMAMKILFVERHKAENFKHLLLLIMKKENFVFSQCVFYSY